MGTHLQIRLVDALAGLSCFACALALYCLPPASDPMPTLRIVVGPSLVVASVCWPFGGWRLALLGAGVSIVCILIPIIICLALVLTFFGGVVL